MDDAPARAADADVPTKNDRRLDDSTSGPFGLQACSSFKKVGLFSTGENEDTRSIITNVNKRTKIFIAAIVDLRSKCHQ